MPSLLVVQALDRPGTAELALLRAAPGLSERGWRITVTGPEGLRPAEAPDEVTWRALPVGGPGCGGALTAVRAFGQARALAEAHDVVYLNGAVPARHLPALRGLRGVRSVLHVHERVARPPAFWGAADLLLASSAASAAPLRSRLARPVLATGLPVVPDPPVVSAPWSADGRPIVGFVGRIDPRQGPLDLVAAAESIRTAVPEVRIVVVGDDRHGSDPAYARLLDRRARAAHVERWGWQGDAAGLLRHLDVVVVPSRSEPFGLIAAEALAVGVPVVAAAVGGLVDVVRDGVTGHLVAPGDPKALAHGVVWALRERPLLGDACREAAARWALPAWTDQLDRLLRTDDPAAAVAAAGPPAAVASTPHR